MRKTFFTNKPFYYLFISYLLLLLIYNIYNSIKLSLVYGLIPIFIETVLLVFVFTQNEYAKLLIKIWVIIFMLVAPGSGIIAYLMDGFNNSFENFPWNTTIYELITLGAGILILSYTNRTVRVLFPDQAFNSNFPDETLPNL